MYELFIIRLDSVKINFAFLSDVLSCVNVFISVYWRVFVIFFLCVGSAFDEVAVSEFAGRIFFLYL